MKSLKGITNFVSVADSGSFAAAAKLLGVSAVAVSKNVITLERQLGVRLFQRTTRSLSLTLEGHAFYAQCKAPLRQLEAAQAMVEQSKESATGLLRVTCIRSLGLGFIFPILNRFSAQYPKVRVEIHLDNEIHDIVEKAYDVGIRVGMLKDSSQIARSIAPLPFVICASPDYLKRRGQPLELADLSAHSCIRQTLPGRLGYLPWLVRDMSDDLSQSMHGPVVVNDFDAAVIAALQGLGLICTPLPLVMPLFRSGQLCPVLTSHIQPKLEAYLRYPNRKNLPARTRAFVDFVLAELRQEKDLQTPAQQLIAPFI